MIDFIDDFLNSEDYNQIFEKCRNAPYSYGEVDKPGYPPTGMVHQIYQDNPIFDFLANKIKEKIECTRNLRIYRMYVNCFAPREIAYYHTDAEVGITCILYLNDSFHLDDGGETQFVLQDKSINIFPIPNRMCFFDSSILHKATPFTNKHRFTLAIKYVPL